MNFGNGLKYVKVLLPLVAGIFLAIVLVTVGPTWWGGLNEQIAAMKDTTAFTQKPIFVGTMKLSEGESLLQPYALFLSSDSLYVSFFNTDRVDIFDKSFKRVKTLHLAHGDSSSITGVAADDQRIYVADMWKREIRFHDREGKILQAFSWLPNKSGRLRPHGLNLFKGNLYVTDIEQKQMLVISVSNAEGITEEGELLFAIPGPRGDSTLFHCPAYAAVTPDGRILVTDFELHAVSTFTCNGRFAYQFENLGDARLMGPCGMAFDNLLSPQLLEEDKKSFDPSGVRHQGRIHVVDSKAGEVVVYDALGNYVLRYGRGELQYPNGIAIEQERRIIIVADAKKHSLVVYKY